MSDQQRLNSVDRFRKRPGRLVLEEHGNCEVPAGCGGVVLRWRNPCAAMPVTVYLYTPVPARCFLDGSELQTGRTDLAPGRHVVACAIEDVDLSAGLLLLAAVYDPQWHRKGQPADVSERPLKVTTDDDGTWKYSLGPFPDDWAAPSFDDRGWPALTKAPTPQLGRQDSGAHRCRRCVELGAACLGLPLPAAGEQRASWWQRLLGRAAAPDAPVPGSVRVRKVFEVPAPEQRGPGA